MVLAFKLHGDFVWPPSPVRDANAGSEAGTIELWLLERHGAIDAALRFIPADAPLEQDDLAASSVATVIGGSASQYLAAATDDFHAHPDPERLPSLWLDDAARAQGLVFRGATLLEEFADARALQLRLPLANEVIYGNFLDAAEAADAAAAAPGSAGPETFSGLRVFLTDAAVPTFSLQLQLPLPVRQSKASSARAFPLALHFPVRWPARPGLPLEIGRLFGGWVTDEGNGGTGVELTISKIPAGGRWFGNFGFSERGTSNADYASDFVIYGSSHAGDYWPSNADCFVNDVLNTYGFSVSPTHWVDYSDNDPADLSLRFWRATDQEPITGLVYRVRVDRDPGAGTGNVGSDLNAYLEGSEHVLTIRLARELGGVIGNSPYFGEDGSADAKVEGWLKTGRRLSADCLLSWDIGDRARAIDREMDWRPVVSVRLHWSEAVSTTQASTVGSDEIFQAGLIGSAVQSFEVVRRALPIGETGQPVSFLPTLELSDARTVRFCLYGTPIAARMSSDGLISWGQQLVGGKDVAWDRPAMRLSLAHERDLIEKTAEISDERKLSVRASAISFFRPPAVEVTLVLEHDESWPFTVASGSDAGFFASFSLSSDTRRAWSGRLASLDFSALANLAIPDENDLLKGYLRVGGAGSDNALGNRGARLLYPQGRVAAQISLPLAVSEVTPMSVDVQRFDRTGRPAPLLIDLGVTSDSIPDESKAGSPPIRYWLRATETLLPREDRKLFAEVFDQAKDLPLHSYAVLSTQPFAVFRFVEQPLASRGDQEGTSVAIYDGDTRSWQFKLVSRHYRYSLPPQAIGESADKPGRLEIHDLDIENAPVPRPYVRREKDGSPDEFASNRDRRAVEYRLTPSAELWITPSDIARGYFMREAASHDIFRQYGAYGLGAALAYLRAEFLYGLSVGINVSKETSIARGARVAEIEALVGRLPGPARETDAEPLVADRWDALRQAIARRPERLEIWARDLDSDIDFAPARFSEGASFCLRGTALHRPPLIEGKLVPNPEGKDQNPRWPKVGHDGSSVPERDPALPRHHPQGLSGGALWPMESLNLFNILMDSPHSSGGTIERIALSPIGGDATQKAEFLNGQVAIISETYNGRVQRQQFEVIGRIGALWHRAKHVVVYERTVNPSAQFAPKHDLDGTRSRRPILRKVSEYIELLQPERGYPDFSAASERHAGFLSRVRFNSRIINVDSAWSSEVGTFGWQIPLWNRHSARERPQVYPAPDIAFVTVAEGEADQSVVAQECIDPDHLYFFADFKAGTSDTDSWQTRPAIDFANMPAASVLVNVFDTKQNAPAKKLAAGAPEPRRPPVARILPGLRRFTWRLAPAAQKTALNAGRAGKPVYVGLESVSFMRATHRDTDHKTLSEQLKTASGVTVSLVDDGSRYWSVEGTGAHPSLQATATTIAAQLDAVKALNPDDPNYLQQVKDALTVVVQTRGAATGAIAGIVPADIDNLKSLSSGLPSKALCQKLEDDATSTIRRKELLVRTALADFVADWDGRLAKLTPPIDKQTQLKLLRTEAVSYIKPLFDEASQDIAKVGEAVERARAIVLDVNAELDAIFARASGRLEQFRRGYDDSKPWSPERRAAFRAGAEAAVRGVIGDVEAAVEEAAGWLAIEVGDVGQQISGHITKAMRVVNARESNILGRVVSLEAICVRYLAELSAEILDAGTSVNGTLAALRQKLTNDANLTANPALQTTLLDHLTTLETAVPAAVARAKAAGATLDTQIDTAIADFTAAITQLSAVMRDLGSMAIVETTALAAQGQALVSIGATEIAEQLNALDGFVQGQFARVASQADGFLRKLGTASDAIVLPILEQLDRELQRLHSALTPLPDQVALIGDDISRVLVTAQAALSPSGLLTSQISGMISHTLEALLKPLPEQLGSPSDVADLRRQLQQLANGVGDLMGDFASDMHSGVADITAACDAVAGGITQVESYLNMLATQGADHLRTQAEGLYGSLDSTVKDLNDAAKLIDAANDFELKLRSLYNDVSRSLETAKAYGDRVFDAVSKLDEGGLLAAPSKLLKLYSAVTNAPEIAALKADIERIRSTFDELDDIISVTKTNALFNRLGDELKALGLSIPFSKIGDRLLPDDLSSLDIGSVFRNFGGAKLDRLFKGYKIPAGIGDAVKITHDFDKKQARAWVQVDIAAPFPGRRSLFSLGVFKADFVDMQLSGRVRLEVSSDSEKVAVTGFGHIATTLDAVVGGQSMVKFEKFGLEFTKEKGLDVQFDPKNVKLNPQFKWIQDFLSGLFPDLGGGLEWIKENGIPVGVQHDFVLPPLSLTFGTSGVSNISIENHFKLVAFPDFLIANRFNLSSIDRPFIFSIFIIGGTGYIQIEAQYRPIKNELAVLVEAGAGGSAQLAFAFGPFIGQIFITISGVLSYRKVLGQSGGGLTISMVLVIAGQVDVCGIVTVGITLMLRMSYRDSGQVDADGTLTVTIRISKFFKLRARAQVNYKLRGGKSETTTNLSADAELEGEAGEMLEKAKKLKESAEKLEGALN